MTVAHPFAEAIENADDDAYFDLLAPEAVLHSPVLHSPFVGRPTVAPLLALLRACFSNVRFTDEMHAEGTVALVFKADIAGRQAEGTQVLRLDDAGRIVDLTVFLRPIRAGMALSELMGSKIQKLDDGTYGLAAVL
ncbi:nuclear transport factor 2 family protein [Mycobacterium sp. WMMD1722]|uniref:nuclear transport factor 2 family protein n=1 Tax=Mycobacterium sp. WMMD1722 TaxID=3404117 RepID=UPI003BF53A73